MTYRLMILDRDGVLNQDSDAYIKSVAEWIPIPGSFEQLGVWSRQGLRLALASNQSAVARGYMTPEDFQAVHLALLNKMAEVGASFCDIQYCLDDPEKPSDRRKPNSGMLLAAMAAAQVSPQETLFIGDTFTDFQAAQRAQIDFVLVLTGKGRRTLEKCPHLLDDIPIFESLSEVDLKVCERFYRR